MLLKAAAHQVVPAGITAGLAAFSYSQDRKRWAVRFIWLNSVVVNWFKEVIALPARESFLPAVMPVVIARCMAPFSETYLWARIEQ